MISLMFGPQLRSLILEMGEVVTMDETEVYVINVMVVWQRPWQGCKES